MAKGRALVLRVAVWLTGVILLCSCGQNIIKSGGANGLCRNGVVDAGETCDAAILEEQLGACPTRCDDGNTCTTDVLRNDGLCTAACEYVVISACVNGDGCCPSGCAPLNDADCSTTCGNTVVESGETCDPPSSCSTSCDDVKACTIDTMTGSAANCNVACSHQAITICGDNDGCCPSGCTIGNDNDCKPICGDGVVTTPETCDGNCLVTCNDGNACTIDSMTGSAATCNVACSHQTITECKSGDSCCPAGCYSITDNDCNVSCGNGVVEAGETCDGNCPVSCNDGNACTTDSMTGSAAACDVTCGYQMTTRCTNNDGCCPTGCNSTTDGDCSVSCGNGVVESGETCDGNCPVSCDDGDACTIDTMTGSASTCTVACGYQSITYCANSDGCCSTGCNSITDNDCDVYCGNGVVETGETCDGNCPVSCSDGNACTIDTLTGSPADCSVVCGYQAVTACANSDGCCPSGCVNANDNDCAPVGISLVGTWGAHVSTPGTITVTNLGSQTANIDLWIRIFMASSGAMQFNICKLTVVSTPDAASVVTTWGPYVIATMQTTGTATGTITVPVGSAVPWPTFTIYSGQTAGGTSVDARPPPFPGGDGDGRQGVTIPTTVNGTISLNVYLGLTIPATMNGTLIDANTITGAMSFSSTGKVFGSSSIFFSSGNINLATSNPTFSFTSQRFDTTGATTCDYVVSAIP